MFQKEIKKGKRVIRVEHWVPITLSGEYPAINGWKCIAKIDHRDGINLVDIAKLTHTHVVNNRIEYQRSKTSGKFSILITPDMNTILERYNNDASIYLFPILSNDTKGIKKTVTTFGGNLNRSLRKIAKTLDIPEFSFYAARHSFASILRTNNVSIDLISQALGHGDIKITEVYLSSFPSSKIDSISSNLL